MSAWHGHYHTVAGRLLADRRPTVLEGTRPFATTLVDERSGIVTLTGLFDDDPSSSTLLLLVHGLGGSVDSPYVGPFWRAARERRLAVLRLNLRGADRKGHDFYHAGLVADPTAALASVEASRFDHVVAVGFSLGGHVLLRLALDPGATRLRAIAALCPPLDLETCQRHIDRRRAWLYRRHILKGLREIYASCAGSPILPMPVERTASIRTLREWDSTTVVPRFGFRDVSDYYSKMSVGPRLREIVLPTEIVSTRHDPMVPAPSLEPFIRELPPHVSHRFLERGGHLGFVDPMALAREMLDDLLERIRAPRGTP